MVISIFCGPSSVHTSAGPQKLDAFYVPMMQQDRIAQLTHMGDMGAKACAIRLLAARTFAGKTQGEVATEVGIKKTALSNMETARSFPTRAVMQYFYRRYRVDFNFLLNGDFAQLPGDVQDALFSALEAANSVWDQREGSYQDQPDAQSSPLS